MWKHIVHPAPITLSAPMPSSGAAAPDVIAPDTTIPDGTVRRNPAGPAVLTVREREIVRLVALRLSNKEIGARLAISARTVGTHLANVFDKTGVRNRTALGDLVRERARME